MGSTKKVKSAGRYGAKYGIGIRRRLLKVEGEQKKPKACPYCGMPKIKRLASGIFYCRKCDAKFAGGAYFPQTLPGSIVGKMVSQKNFLGSVKELIHATEISRGEEEETGTESVSPSKKSKKSVSVENGE